MSSTYEDESSNIKVSRKARRRAKERELNHSVTVLCSGSGELHLADNVTIKQLEKRFPDLTIHPRATYTLDVSDICPDCIKVEKEKQARREASNNKKKEFEERKAQQKSEAIDRRLETIRKLYRCDEEQKTRVTLHDVHFLKKTPQGPVVCRGSFYGQVAHYWDAKTADGYEVCITIKLTPRPDVNFREVGPVDSRSGLSLGKSKSGFAMVKLNAQHIDKDSKVVRLGGRCNPKKCKEPKENCPDHALDDIVELGAPAIRTN